jgi:2-iminobutanoate/2-iminopropanoate deaminase
MNRLQLCASVFSILGLSGCVVAPKRTYFPFGGAPPAFVAASAAARSPPFSAGVMVGNTLYVSGGIDADPATGRIGSNPEESAKFVLDGLQNSLARAGMTMDDLVWVQIFCTDLSYAPTFNAVYKTYFHGSMPARAFLGVDHLLGNAHFEVMGIAVGQSQ